MMGKMDLPLVLYHRSADFPLKAYRPRDGEPPNPAHCFLVAVPEDLEKVPIALLARLYNQANPKGPKVNSFKPGTIVRFCLPALIKLAEEEYAGEEIPTAPKNAEEPEPEEQEGESTKALIDKITGEETTAPEPPGKPPKAPKAKGESLSAVIRAARLAGKNDEEVYAAAIAHPKYEGFPQKARAYAKMYLKHYVDNPPPDRKKKGV